MKEPVSVLFVHLDATQVAPLEASLEGQPVKVLRSQSCREAAEALAGPEPPHLVFVDAALPDGCWANVIALARQASVPINVIIVARLVDTRFYVEVIEAGAYDFISPPFRSSDLEHIVRCALQDVLERREAQVSAQHAAQRQLFPRGFPSANSTRPNPRRAEVFPVAHKAL